MSLKIIFATNEHLDAIVEIWGENRQTLGLMPRDAFADSIKKRWILLCCIGKEIVGYLQFRHTMKTQTLSIVHLCIEKSHRGKGYPTLLLDRLVKEFKYKARGIKLNCRSDYQSAERFWNRYGFQPKGQQPSRGNDPNVHLVTWWYSFGTVDLFSTNFTEDKIKAVLDFNILAKMMDCKANDEAREQILELSADWMVSEIEYSCTSETTNELFRDKDRGRQLKTKQFLKGFPELNIDKSKLKGIESELEIIYKGKSINDLSDRRQLAETILSGIPYFVTLDAGILKYSNQVFDTFNLKIIEPYKLRLEIDYSINASDYYPNKLSATNFYVGKVKPKEISDLDSIFLRNSSGEKKQDFNKNINFIVSKGSRGQVQIVKEGSELVALVSYYTEQNCLIISAIRTKQYHLAQTIFMQNVTDLLRVALSNKKSFLIVSDQHLTLAEKKVLIKYNFNEIDKQWVRGIKQGIVSLKDLRTELVSFESRVPEVMALLQEIENSKDLKYYLNILSLEKVLWPLKILEAEIPCFIIPIKPNYARELFDTMAANLDLFGVEAKLIWNKDNVYYRAIAPNVEKYPARILWYSSENKHSPRSKAIVCSSYLNEVIIGPATDIFKKHERFGVFSWNKDILPLAKGNPHSPIKLLMFSDSEPFENPISIKRIKDVLALNNEKDNNFQSPLRIKSTTFMELYALGKGIVYKDAEKKIVTDLY